MSREETIADTVISRNGQLKANKVPYLDQFQRVGEFVHTRKQEFENTHPEGDFLTDELFDGSAPKAAKTAASSILSNLWPQSPRRLKITAPRGLKDTEEHKKYYEAVTEINLGVLDNPKGGLPTALDEYMLDEITFGTAGIDVMPDPETKVRYTPWGVKHMSIAEGKGGFVDTVYMETEQTVQRLVMEYGIDKVSTKVRESFEKKDFDRKELILVAIEPRLLRNPRGRGNRDMPFQSIHLEITQKHILRESGFEEFPMVVGRFWKILKEVYGRSPAMDALPDIQEVNVVREGLDVAIEKTLDPPLAVLHDSILGNGEVNTSAGGLTVFNIAGGRAGEKNPIFPLFTVGDVRPAEKLVETLQEIIANHFFIDRLLDFNNETRMTLGEAQIRNRLRNATLGSIFSRQIAEVFNPLIERTFNILLSQNELGVVRGSVEEQVIREFEDKEPLIIPDEIARRMQAGEDVFRIEYFTPALRIMQAEEVESILSGLSEAALLQPVVPDVFDNINSDAAIRQVFKLFGAAEFLHAETKTKEIRDIRQAQLAKQQEMEQIQAGADAARNLGQSGLVPTERPKEAA